MKWWFIPSYFSLIFMIIPTFLMAGDSQFVTPAGREYAKFIAYAAPRLGKVDDARALQLNQGAALLWKQYLAEKNAGSWSTWLTDQGEKVTDTMSLHPYMMGTFCALVVLAGWEPWYALSALVKDKNPGKAHIYWKRAQKNIPDNVFKIYDITTRTLASAAVKSVAAIKHSAQSAVTYSVNYVKSLPGRVAYSAWHSFCGLFKSESKPKKRKFAVRPGSDGALLFEAEH